MFPYIAYMDPMGLESFRLLGSISLVNILLVIVQVRFKFFPEAIYRFPGRAVGLGAAWKRNGQDAASVVGGWVGSGWCVHDCKRMYCLWEMQHANMQ